MNILAIDTSGNVASVAIVNDVKTIAAFTVNNLLNHSVTIMPMVDQTLTQACMTLHDMDAIACANGPGSFTGLRIGAATAKGLAHGAGKKIVPVPTLDALAYNVFDGTRLIAPIMDARRSQVYTAFFEWRGDVLHKLTDDFADDVGRVLAMAALYGRETVFVGDGTLVYRDQIISAGFTTGPPHLNMQRAEAVGALGLTLARQNIFTDYARFAPVYIRLPQAERELEQRSKQHEGKTDDRN